MLARELGDGVDAARVRQRVLVVGLSRRAVEDVVGAEVHEARAGLGAAGRQALYRPHVDRERLVLLALADLHVVEGGAVEARASAPGRRTRARLRDSSVTSRSVRDGAGSLRAALQDGLESRRPARLLAP